VIDVLRQVNNFQLYHGKKKILLMGLWLWWCLLCT